MSYGGGSGGGSIHASSDVALSNPVDGNVLSYSNSLAKWQNADITTTLDTRYVTVSNEGVSGGVATLDSSGLVPTNQLPLSTQSITIAGSGVPSSVTGLNGDTYIDYTSGNVHLKTSGSWGAAVSAFSMQTAVNKTAAYTAVSGNVIFASGTFTITSPAPSVGAVVTVKNSGTGAITFAPVSGTVDGAATKVISTQYASAQFICDGTNWGVF